ncbi:hypothetical protein [Paludifilum halophilum]|uniref:Sporulation membrane protein YtrI C-terminal domain-containing protein n=1 Tax=Paludifilum halophilum TaxID=1642702 RepID=A0A235B839_9BACL|nr:hypothetical protein [Paludifilum halophilum]OYD08421.1 hypothetical protein CHM34_06200 [Paludifilum halophilum]
MKRHRHLRLMVSFLFGTIAGAALMTLLYGQKLDSLYLERDTLYYSNNQKNKELQQIRGELDKHAEQDARQRANSEQIQKVQVEVETDEPFHEEEIKEKVRSILEPFIGKSIHWVSNDPSVLDTMLKERTIQLPDKNKKAMIQLQLKYIAFIDSQLKIWVNAREVSDKDVSFRSR